MKPFIKRENLPYAQTSLGAAMRRSAEVHACAKDRKRYLETLIEHHLPQVESQRDDLEAALEALKDCYHATAMGARDADQLAKYICNRVAPILRDARWIS